MFLIHLFDFIACNCDKAGSQSQTCDGNRKCTCKYGHTGQNCNVCAVGFYKKWNDSQYICSGISINLLGFIAMNAKIVV